MPKKSKLKTAISSEALFEHWANLPVLQEISDTKFFEVSQVPVRSAILKVLRVGLFDKEFKQTRHLMRAKELLDLVNEELVEDAHIGLSKLYYHLEKLEQIDHIDHLAIVKGNHRIKYYSRKAKFYLYDSGEYKESKVKEFLDPLEKIVKYLHPELTDKYFQDKVTDSFKILKELNYKWVKWIKANHELINELDIDPLELFTSFSTMSFLNKSVHQSLNPVYHLLEQEVLKER